MTTATKTPSQNDQDISSCVIFMMDEFLRDIGNERSMVTMTEVTDLALDIRNICTQGV